MTVGIIGLGLIGGSFARAVTEFYGAEVLGDDIDETTFLAARMVGAVSGRLTPDRLGECDFVIVSLYPSDTVKYVKNNEKYFKNDSIIVDCSGVKKCVCDEIGYNPDRQFTFIGGHPMAGTQQWGFGSSRASLFKGGSMILTPFELTSIPVRERAKKFFAGLGFGDVVFTTPEAHDERIAFTSQLPHVISNAYVKSPRALEHRGFSAGSYKDLTRVSKLNVPLWTELFLDNRDNLTAEIDLLIENLKNYSDALKRKDKKAVEELLQEGTDSKKVAK